MSRMIPQETVDTMRHAVDVSVGLYGISCVLHIPSNIDTVINYDVYKKPADFTYDPPIVTEVFIDWKPTKARLRKLGLFMEGDLPIVAWFKNVEDGNDLDILIDSWFTIDDQFIPDQIDTEEFEIVDILIPGMHDAVITKFFKIAPRRKR